MDHFPWGLILYWIFHAKGREYAYIKGSTIFWKIGACDTDYGYLQSKHYIIFQRI